MRKKKKKKERKKKGTTEPRYNGLQRSVISLRNEDDVGGRASVTRDEERVLRGG